jgi:iron complex outermembrane recepter protein
MGLYSFGASVGAIAIMLQAGAASAQQTPATQQAAPADTGIKDIVVTAQRRVESVQKSSLDIQVLGGRDLAGKGVSQARDLSALVPGLQISLGGNQTQTYIRGVGDFSSTALGQSAVAYNVDGIYIADQASVGPLFYDVARVEVLKGPQGTLYGRNSSAGALNILTNRPTDRLSGDASLEVGNYDSVRTTGALNVPLTSTLWVRAAFNYVTRNGYLSDGSDDDKQQSGRVSALWKPDDRLSIFISADIEHFGGKGPGAVLLPQQGGTGKFTGAVNATDNAAIVAASGLPSYLLYLPGEGIPGTRTDSGTLINDGSRDNLQKNIMAEIGYDLGFAKLTFVPAYRTSDNNYFGYTSGFPFVDDEKTRQQSYELRLNKDTATLKAVVGLFFMDLDQTIDQRAYISPIPVLTTAIDVGLGSKSYAAFGQATYSLTSALRLIGGLRYTHETRTIDGTRSSLAASQPVTGQTTFDAVSFRTGFEYDLAPHNMLYGTVSRGFKSGGFNTFTATAAASNVYRPETLYSYTLGLRNRFDDNRLQVNIEGFYWDYLNSQQSHLAYDPLGNLQFLTFNAASAAIYGADLDLAFQPTPNDTFSGTLEYLHSRFNDFTYQIPAANYAAGSTGCGVSVGSAFAMINCSGKQLPRAPEWSGTAGYQHRFDLGNGSNILAAFDVNFGASRYLGVDYTASERAPAYFRQNASLTYTLPGGNVSIAGFVKNISNRAVYVGGINAALSPGYFYAVVDAPRTYGLRISGKF